MRQSEQAWFGLEMISSLVDTMVRTYRVYCQLVLRLNEGFSTSTFPLQFIICVSRGRIRVGSGKNGRTPK